jgi:long-subunit fatty acid transport protein
VVHPRGRWTFALYTHRQATFEMAFESQGIFSEGIDSDDGVLLPLRLASRERIDLRMDAVGTAAALRLSERLSVGLTLVYTDARLHTAADSFLPDEDSVDGLFGEISFLPSRRFATTALEVEGSDLTLSAGVLWNVTQRVSAGGFYRQGAEVDGDAAFSINLPGSTEPFSGGLPAAFAAPDVLGAGVAYRSADGRLTLAAELDRVGYQGLVQVRTEEGLEDFAREYENAWEYRLGAEYALLARSPVLAFRAGAWMESPSADFEQERVVHFAAGIGIAGEHLQVDVAADFSSVVDTGAVSFIYSF